MKTKKKPLQCLASTHSVLLTGASICFLSSWGWAQNLPISPQQRATANQVVQAGVLLSELAANAPDSYAVKRGDTLWAISGVFLKTPWRWPELWGMNLNEIANPHLIYPGQSLYLEKSGGRARLRLSQANLDGVSSVKLSPQIRLEKLADGAIPALKSSMIEPFLAEPLVVDANELQAAPRIVAAQEGRVLLSRGDRAYARATHEGTLVMGQGYRVFRNATPLRDPDNGELLGYEAQYLGRAAMISKESSQDSSDKDGKIRIDIVPATLDIVSSKEEMRVGDRLLPEPERQFQSYTPRAPDGPVSGRIVSIYGSTVVNASQNQVVAINRGLRNGIQTGHVMAILKDGARLSDRTDPAKPEIKLPDERNGLLMVFKTFDKVSYALVLEITSSVKVGDRLTNPR